MRWTNRGHEFDSVGLTFQKNDEIYIWGISDVAADLCKKTKALGIPTRIISNDSRWRYMGWNGLDVVNPVQVLGYPAGKTVLVASQDQEQAIFDQLLCAGFQRDVSCFQIDAFIAEYLPIFAVYTTGAVYFKDISVIPSTKCNLNCAQCLNFTPYLQSMQDEPIDALKNQIDLFLKK